MGMLISRRRKAKLTPLIEKDMPSVKKAEGTSPIKGVVKPVVKVEKPNYQEMDYQDLLKLAKDRNIELKSRSKKAVIEALEG